ncbi:hypothetical protein FOZ63_034142, partial [Perkinsus olseni]
MAAVEEAKQRMEELIRTHQRRNPRIAEPEGTADDWIFRKAVKKQFRIFYHISLKRWFYWLPRGRTKGKNCHKPGVMDALRFLCEDQARRRQAEELVKVEKLKWSKEAEELMKDSITPAKQR